MPPVGIAAICETVEALAERSSGYEGLEQAMAAAADRRGGLSLLLAITKKDKSAGGAKGLVALLPSAEGDPATLAAASAALEAMAGVPVLPEALRANGLFQAQDIESQGFGIQWARVEGAPRLRLSQLRPAVTRKTLMPAVLQLANGVCHPPPT